MTQQALWELDRKGRKEKRDVWPESWKTVRKHPKPEENAKMNRRLRAGQNRETAGEQRKKSRYMKRSGFRETGELWMSWIWV